MMHENGTEKQKRGMMATEEMDVKAIYREECLRMLSAINTGRTLSRIYFYIKRLYDQEQD